MKRVLPIIVVSQFFCTSLWSTCNAVMNDLVQQFHVPPEYVGHLTNAVQLGFITGTLVFAILNIADRISPSKVFLFSALFAAAINLAIVIDGIPMQAVMSSRFLTGFFLAGVYPVGMKLVTDHFERGLGRSLSWLVGALVLGTSLPHLLKFVTLALPWKDVIYATSSLCVLGGVAVFLFVSDGPYRKAAAKMNIKGLFTGFKNREFRVAVLGYFGHMWELYTFWVFLPLMLESFKTQNPDAGFNVSLLSFFIIAIGSLACVTGGYISERTGVKRTAAMALTCSCICCLVSPWFLSGHSTIALIIFLFVWSFLVIPDSPLFATLVAGNIAPAIKGSSLTFVSCIGFAITVVSIELMSAILTEANRGYIYMVLAIGPALGLIGLYKVPRVSGKKTLAEQ